MKYKERYKHPIITDYTGVKNAVCLDHGPYSGGTTKSNPIPRCPNCLDEEYRLHKELNIPLPQKKKV